MSILLSLCEAQTPWFAVQVWAGRERLTAEHLRVRGYEVFLPTWRETRVWSDRAKHVERALFTGYLFTRIQAEVLGHVVTAPGVIRIVGSGQGATPVATEEIEILQRVIAARATVEPWPHFEIGDRVRIEVGPLRGAEGVVLTVKSRRRLVVSISLLQRSIGVELEAEWVSAPVEPSALH